MKVLFLDQSGKLGGAELCLADIAQHFNQSSLVGVFVEGTFPEHLRQLDIPAKILTDKTLQVHKTSGLLQGIRTINQLLPLIANVVKLSKNYDLIYANTQKALVVGAIASFLSKRPLVYHLHDIVSSEHFSAINRSIIVTLANRAALVIANSQASRNAFIAAGGRSHIVDVVYNGFRSEAYQVPVETRNTIREHLNLQDKFVVGHFSRLAPWKGQHVLIQALAHCPENVVALFVGDALFGENDYVAYLHQLIKDLNLEHRSHFLGFRSEVPSFMHACELVAHTSTAPEPFGRVIVETMLCGRPIVASAAGGATELVHNGQTGWLFPPGDSLKLAKIINDCQTHQANMLTLATRAQVEAQQRFNLDSTNQHIAKLLAKISPR